jgi:hypothetical protein
MPDRADGYDYKCVFCGAPSQKHPADQEMPPAYCRPEDHQEEQEDELATAGLATVLEGMVQTSLESP